MRPGNPLYPSAGTEETTQGLVGVANTQAGTMPVSPRKFFSGLLPGGSHGPGWGGPPSADATDRAAANLTGDAQTLQMPPHFPARLGHLPRLV